METTADITDVFCNASKKESPQDRYFTVQEWESMDSRVKEKRRRDGIRRFKRSVLGFCGYQTVKSEQFLAAALHVSGVVPSYERGKEVIPMLMNRELYYRDNKYLRIEEVWNHNRDEKKYRITDHESSSSSDD